MKNRTHFWQRLSSLPGEKPFLSSFLLVALALVPALSFFHSHFHVNDDDWVVFMAKGVGISLHPDAHLCVNSILLGYLLEALYSFFPHVDVYAYCLVLAQFLAFGSLLAALFLSSRDGRKGLLFLAGFCFYGLYYCLNLNYTMQGVLLAQSGFFLLMTLFQGDHPPFRGKVIFLGFSCLLFSFLLRDKSLLFGALTAFPFILYSLWGKRLRFRDLWPVFVFVAVLAGCHGWDRSRYDIDPGWKDAKENWFVQQFADMRDFDYNGRTKPIFDQVGWDENDVNLFRYYFFLDKKKYNGETIRKLGKLLPLWSAEGKWGNYTSLYELLFSNPYSIDMLVCFLFFLLFVPPEKLMGLMLSFVWVMALIFLLMHLARAPERVFLPSLTFLANLALFFSRVPAARGKSPKARGSFLHPRWLLLASALMLLMALPVLGKYDGESREWFHYSEGLKASLDQLGPRDDQLFVVWGSQLPHEYMDAFDDFEIYRHLHIFSIGEWSSTPVGQGMLDHFHIKDLCREMVDNPNVFLVCLPLEGAMLHQYMLENYRLEIRALNVFKGYHFNVYRLYDEKSCPGKATVDYWLSKMRNDSLGKDNPLELPSPPVFSKIMRYEGQMEPIQYYGLGKDLIQAKRYLEAKEAFLKAASLDPQFTPPPDFLQKLEGKKGRRLLSPGLK